MASCQLCLLQGATSCLIWDAFYPLMGLIWVGWVILIRVGNACVRSGEDGNLWEGCSLSSPARAVWKETAAHFPDERQRPDCFHDVLIITTLAIVIVITFVIVIIIIIRRMVLWVKM